MLAMQNIVIKELAGKILQNKDFWGSSRSQVLTHQRLFGCIVKELRFFRSVWIVPAVGWSRDRNACASPDDRVIVSQLFQVCLCDPSHLLGYSNIRTRDCFISRCTQM
jgi:hypothetical protein